MNNKESSFPEKESIDDVLNKMKEIKTESPANKNTFIENTSNSRLSDNYESSLTKETDPDLMMSYEIVYLPSEGYFYEDGLSEIKIEYLTSKDEDLLTTPSIIESGNVFDELLRRKVKTPNVDLNKLLTGDRSALILFLRTTSYGTDYTVNVYHPLTGEIFKSTVDLSLLKYKKLVKPGEDGLFTVELPMRKKQVKFRLLTHGEEEQIRKRADALMKEYKQEVNNFKTMKMKAHVVSIDGNKDRSYIDRFLDVMPALDAYKIRNEIARVSPDVDLDYEFVAPDKHKFIAQLSIGVDFFFPEM